MAFLLSANTFVQYEYIYMCILIEFGVDLISLFIYVYFEEMWFSEFLQFVALFLFVSPCVSI